MPVSDAEIDEQLRVILDSPEFQERSLERFERWLEELGQHLEFLRNWGGYWLLAALGLALVLGLAYALGAKVFEPGLAQRSRRNQNGNARAEPDETPDTLLERANALAAAGALRDAALALQHAILLDVCRRRSLGWQPSRSDWEWMHLLEPSQAMVAFTRATQRLAFGPAPERSLFEACARDARSLLAAPSVNEST